MQIQISWLLQKLTDLDLHCLPTQGISRFSRTRVKGYHTSVSYIAFTIFEPAHEKRTLWFSGLWFFKCACTVLYLSYIHALFASRSLPHANSNGPGKTALMCRLAWPFAGRLCDKYPFLKCLLLFLYQAAVSILSGTYVVLYSLSN